MTNIKACLGHIRDTGSSKGRGVFASRQILAGELVEACPVVLLSPYWVQLPEEVKRLLFNWGHFDKGGIRRLPSTGMGEHVQPRQSRQS